MWPFSSRSQNRCQISTLMADLDLEPMMNDPNHIPKTNQSKAFQFLILISHSRARYPQSGHRPQRFPISHLIYIRPARTFAYFKMNCVVTFHKYTRVHKFPPVYSPFTIYCAMIKLNRAIARSISVPAGVKHTSALAKVASS